MIKHYYELILSIILFTKIMETMGGTGYTKIESGIVKGIPAGTQIGNCSNNHKIASWKKSLWFFGTKPVANPSRESSTNFECFQGGYLAVMQQVQQQQDQTPSPVQWQKFSTLPQVLDYNYAQDFIFGLQDQLFMFVYSRWDGFYFYGLYYFCDVDNKWKEGSMVRQGSYSMARDIDCSVVQCSPLDQSVSYVVVIGQSSDHLKVYEFKRNTNWANYVDMNTICSIDAATGFSNPSLLAAAVRGRTIYCLLGTATSGGKVTSWDQTHVLVISLDSCTSEIKQVKGHNQTLTFPPLPIGPSTELHDGASKWILIGGMVSEEAYTRDIWILDLENLEWIRTCHAIPDDLEGSEIVAAQCDGLMYLADKNQAIYTYPLEYLN